MNNKTKFYEILKKYFEVGVLNEIYSSDEISICNVSNYAYIVFCYDTLKAGIDNIGGFCMDKKVIPTIIENNNMFHAIVANWNEQIANDAFVKICDENFKIMCDLKKQTDINGPTNNIDLHMEEEIKIKNKSK